MAQDFPGGRVCGSWLSGFGNGLSGLQIYDTMLKMDTGEKRFRTIFMEYSRWYSFIVFSTGI
jgi:hypothetical protein